MLKNVISFIFITLKSFFYFSYCIAISEYCTHAWNIDIKNKLTKLRNHYLRLFIDDCKMTKEVLDFFAGEVKVHKYSEVTEVLKSLVAEDTGKVWVGTPRISVVGRKLWMLRTKMILDYAFINRSIFLII